MTPFLQSPADTMNIKLYTLYRHSSYLQPLTRVKTQSPVSDKQNLLEWWKGASKELKDEVLSDREKDEAIQAVGVEVARNSKVVIFAHEFVPEFNKYTNPQVIALKDIADAVILRPQKRTVPQIEDMVMVEWEDASTNPTPATIEDIKNVRGILDVINVGFLMDQNEERTFIGGRYNPTYAKYRYVGAIPTKNIKKITRLVF